MAKLRRFESGALWEPFPFVLYDEYPHCERIPKADADDC